MSREEPKFKCPLVKRNPGQCPFTVIITENRTDIKWIKKLVGIRTIIDVIGYVSLIIAIAGVTGVI